LIAYHEEPNFVCQPLINILDYRHQISIGGIDGLLILPQFQKTSTMQVQNLFKINYTMTTGKTHIAACALGKAAFQYLIIDLFSYKPNQDPDLL